MIKIQCAKCGQKYKTNDEMAGLKGKCNCGSIMAIPSKVQPNKTPKGITSQKTAPAKAISYAGGVNSKVGNNTHAQSHSTFKPQRTGPDSTLEKNDQPLVDTNAINEPESKSNQIPSYFGVSLIGTCFVIFGVLTTILGGIGIVLSIMGTNNQSPERVSGSAVGLGAFTFGLIILGGLFQIGFGQLFYCIRDMARNTFYLRK